MSLKQENPEKREAQFESWATLMQQMLPADVSRELIRLGKEQFSRQSEIQPEDDLDSYLFFN